MIKKVDDKQTRSPHFPVEATNCERRLVTSVAGTPENANWRAEKFAFIRGFLIQKTLSNRTAQHRQEWLNSYVLSMKTPSI